MHIYRATFALALSLSVNLAVPATTVAGQEKSELQADIYNELYEANVKCNDELRQSRSEFIVDMFERNRGNRVSRELLRKLLHHNTQIAQEELEKARNDRRRYMSERMMELESLVENDRGSDERFRERQEQLRLLDEKISAKKRYIEVNLCVLSVLQ